jgi:hypothetical protein
MVTGLFPGVKRSGRVFDYPPLSSAKVKGTVELHCWWGGLREGDHWGDQDVDGRIILRGIFRKWEGIVGTGWSGLRIGNRDRWWTLVNMVMNLRVP